MQYRQRTSLPDLWQILERIQITLGIDASTFAEALKLTPDQFLHFKQHKKIPSLIQMERLAQDFNLSIESLIKGEIDYQTLAQQYFGNKTHMPEKYLKYALGKRRTHLLILNFIESFLGWRERAHVLRYFQMNEAMFANPDAPISIAFGTDLLEYLVKYRMDLSMIPKIGEHALLSATPAAVKHELVDCKSAHEIYERMCDYIVGQYFEKNYTYQIQRMTPQSCTVIAKPSEQLLDLLTHIQQKPETEMMRIGNAAAYPKLLNLPAASVKQTSSIWGGDSFIRYEINYEAAQNTFQKRLKQSDPQVPRFLS